jgi:hypothetical protein
MDRLTGSAAFAAVLLSFTLAGCGGSPGSSAAPSADIAAVVQGISTPSSVSVVTAKNAQ